MTILQTSQILMYCKHASDYTTKSAQSW